MLSKNVYVVANFKMLSGKTKKRSRKIAEFVSDIKVRAFIKNFNDSNETKSHRLSIFFTCPKVRNKIGKIVY